MNKSTTSESSSSSSSSMSQRMTNNGARGLTLTELLLKKPMIIRILAHMTSLFQVMLLLVTCAELRSAAVEDIFRNHYQPAVCDLTQGDSLRLYRKMAGTANSRRLVWLIKMVMEELKLPPSMMDEEMLIMFGGMRFSVLRKLDFGGVRLGIWNYAVCSITDVGMAEVGKCTNLQSLNLAYCSSITDAGMAEVGKCTNLQSLNLSYYNITDECKNALRKSIPNLTFF